ncbi:MAG: DMT family transporter [Formosimonas sp.]
MNQHRTLATTALLAVVLFWGLSWVAYRELYLYGMSGMSVSLAMTTVAVLCSGVFSFKLIARRAWRGTPRYLIALIMLASAFSNVGFVWGMVHGEVMRVMLLFYLMPVWSALLAPLVLKERSNWVGNLAIGFGLLGAVIMLYKPELGFPAPSNPAEWAGLLAGMGSGALNVLVRKTPELDDELRSFFSLAGSVVLSAVWLQFEAGPHLPTAEHVGGAVLILLGLGVFLFMINRLYQYGLRHLTTHQAVVIFPVELVIGAVSSWWIAGEVMGEPAMIGGALIVSAAFISAWWGKSH